MVLESIIVERLGVCDNYSNILSDQEKFEIMKFYKFFRFYLDSFLLKTVLNIRTKRIYFEYYSKFSTLGFSGS